MDDADECLPVRVGGDGAADVQVGEHLYHTEMADTEWHDQANLQQACHVKHQWSVCAMCLRSSVECSPNGEWTTIVDGERPRRSKGGQGESGQCS